MNYPPAKVMGPSTPLVREVGTTLEEEGRRPSSTLTRLMHTQVQQEEGSLLSMVSDVRPLVQQLLIPGVVVCCYADVPERSCLLRRLVMAAEVANLVAPLPSTQLTKETPRFPNHLLILVDSRTAAATGGAGAGAGGGPRSAVATSSTGDAALNDWLWRTESTYDDRSGKVDVDTVRRNELKMMAASLFLSVKVRYYVGKDIGVSSRLAGEVDMLLRQAPRVEPARVAKISRRLGEIREPNVYDYCAKSFFAWAEEAAMTLLQEEFVEFCRARLHRMTHDAVKRKYDDVLGRCRRLLTNGTFGGNLNSAGGSSELLAATERVVSAASTALDDILLVIHKAEEKRMAAQREAAANGTLAARGTSTRDVGSHGNVLYPVLPALAFLSPYVPHRHHFWLTKTGVSTMLMLLLFVIGAWVMRPAR